MAMGTVSGPPQRLLDERAALYQPRFSVNISQILLGWVGGEAQPVNTKPDANSTARQSALDTLTRNKRLEKPVVNTGV